MHVFRVLERGQKPVPFVLLLLSRFFNPMQGVFNILVYCRPHVSSLRTNNPGYYWLKAFWQTVRTGGDNNSAGQSRRSRSSNRSNKGSKKVLQKMERNHILMMAKIRKARNLSNSFVLNGDDIANSEAIEMEDQVCEDCGSQCLTPTDAEKVGVVLDDESSSLDDSDDLLIDRAVLMMSS